MKKYLMTPGPTPVPPRVLQAMHRPMIHHRSQEYGKLLGEVTEGLRYVLQTRNDILVFSSSGTGGMEAAVVNLLSPKDRILIISTGVFGERFVKIAERFGIDVETIRVEWGQAVDPALVSKKLGKSRGIKAVFATLMETSTGVTNDIQAIGEIVSKYPAVLVVDAVSGLGCEELRTDAWGVDVVISASQKGLMTPPGLSLMSISPKAWKLVQEAKLPRFYWDLRRYREFLGRPSPQNPYTPAVSLIYGLREALKMIREEGLAKVLRRHERLAASTRACMKALGLELFAEARPANGLTAVKVPQGVDGLDLLKTLQRYGVTAAGGQERLRGKIFRVAHMGYIDISHVIGSLKALERSLPELGYSVESGVGVRAARMGWKE